MTPIRTLAALAVAAALSSVAAAQAPAAAPQGGNPQAAAPSPPPPPNPANMPKCEKPDAHPGRMASQQRLNVWNKSVTQWQDCMKKGIAELQGKADAAVKEAQAAIADSNAAIASYNDAVKEFNAQVEAAK